MPRGKFAWKLIAALLMQLGIDPEKVRQEVEEFLEEIDAEQIGRIIDNVEEITVKILAMLDAAACKLPKPEKEEP